MQTTVNNITPADNLFTHAATSMPTPMCVTAFIAPQSLASVGFYADGTASIAEPKEIIISVGTYMSDRSIWHICNFTNAANALKYAFMLKGENCPISKNAFAFLQAEIKRTGAVSSRTQKINKVEENKADEEIAVAEVIKLPKPVKSASVPVAPLIKQYKEMKIKHPDAILLFRIGDFYETFSDDAITAAEILNITLTRRANGKAGNIELAGFPKHALDTYLPKLVRAGKRVAICEQLEQPKKCKKATEKV